MKKNNNNQNKFQLGEEVLCYFDPSNKVLLNKEFSITNPPMNLNGHIDIFKIKAIFRNGQYGKASTYYYLLQSTKSYIGAKYFEDCYGCGMAHSINGYKWEKGISLGKKTNEKYFRASEKALGKLKIYSPLGHSCDKCYIYIKK